ncbi:MAG: hypothetical protein ACXABD_21795 [Candidatus Thorarchaeota archaeon]
MTFTLFIGDYIITLAILSSTAGTVASNLPALIPSKLNRENKRRLEELKRREEQGLLGLTSKEEAAIGGRLRTTADQAAEQAAQQQKALLAGGGSARGGQALAQAQAAQQQRMELEQGVGQKILEADLAERQRETDEMRALEAAVEERRRELVGAVGSVAGAGIEAGFTTAAQQSIIQGQKDISPAKVSALSQQLGVSDAEARGYYELAIENPELLKYMTALQSGG